MVRVEGDTGQAAARDRRGLERVGDLDRAELRSLSSMEQAVQRWGGSGGLTAAAGQLGFPLP
ncbi:hypothetical protein ACWD5Q_32200 [Streptomyces sp. NPDC002513]